MPLPVDGRSRERLGRATARLYIGLGLSKIDGRRTAATPSVTSYVIVDFRFFSFRPALSSCCPALYAPSRLVRWSNWLTMLAFRSAGRRRLPEPIFRPGMESGLKTEKPENPGHDRSLADTGRGASDEFIDLTPSAPLGAT